jgi:D-serine deaminase-like pyridoxal phosphate-dependent protein
MTEDWRGPNASLIGEPGSRYRLETPALVVDVDALDRNIATMAEHARLQGYGLRPCAKVHKSVEIARRQVLAGALGLCCATLAEAECMAAAGIPGVMLFSTVVTPGKLARLGRLNAGTEGLIVVTDDPENVAELGRVAASSGRTLQVMADFEMHGGRTGARSREDVVVLAKRIADTPGLAFAGLLAYNGLVLCIPDYDDRTKAALANMGELSEVIDRLREEGLAPAIVSGGGTGTHEIDAETGLFTEIQVGTYIFMDANYSSVAVRREEPAPFELALAVYATVISSVGDDFVITDGGAKEVDGTFGALKPTISSGAPAGSAYALVGDDLGRIDLQPGQPPPPVGQLVSLVPPHAWHTVPMYSVYHCVSGDTLVDIWPVDALRSW